MTPTTTGDPVVQGIVVLTWRSRSWGAGADPRRRRRRWRRPRAVRVDNQAGLAVQVDRLDASGARVGLGEAELRPDHLPRDSRHWRSVDARRRLRGREVHRASLTRSELAAGNWTVTIPAGATSVLERADTSDQVRPAAASSRAPRRPPAARPRLGRPPDPLGPSDPPTRALVCCAFSFFWQALLAEQPAQPATSNSQAAPAARQELLDDGDELAFGVPFAEIPQRLGHLRQPIATVDDRGDRSCLAEPNQRRQALHTWSNGVLWRAWLTSTDCRPET
jgi:hypothetical protein